MRLEMRWGDSARTLAADFGQRAVAHDREGSFPHANFADLQRAGLLALAAPRAWGGQQASVAELAEVIGAIGYGCPATALVLSMQYLQQRGMFRAGSFWPEHLARQLVQEAAGSVSLANALRVEPELGTPARGGLPATVARRTPDGWRLSGRKIYSTGAPILRWYVVWARTDDAEPLVGSFLVRADSPGVRIETTWDHLGLRASGSHDVILDGVPTPLDHAMGLAAPGAQARDVNAQADMTVLLGALYTGVALAARDWLLNFLRERTPSGLGAPLATLPRVQEAVGRIEALLLSNQRLLASLASDLDRGEQIALAESGLVKTLVMRQAAELVQEALALTSNHGLSRRNPLERHLRDVLCGRIHTPQEDSALVVAGRHALEQGQRTA
ncbi:acyl-CoA dehydrogenase family protein [Comamonas endophytica]|uniref:Acyl-CoA/acyl-ACP dehydrogenase n=2 Tax=Comamonas endophytica TaxID=2949090 RepID=A0ABY6GBE2_9BURK|nr:MULTISPECIES: acyl-CoA dehydrogenase family protein [unclassified Acidovorax]MCD2513747.1 acyl-CoA/acyl-ACP dehydrogenase [Acidovorax sp. D4N7]UYG52248.1 acyl-CoA/acyl-ACP dehydrogenase [Acidovorax sp. 5MLIR]